jgi:glucose-6-phosphate 1-dehydrogenase
VNAVFSESQVFRIDHYLGKETVQNVLVFRFANGIFEPVWNRNYIDHVQITAAESIGIEGRGPFYEKAGALRDIIQNHMMELLGFVTMEPPSGFEAESVRREKVKVWQAIPNIPIKNAVRGRTKGHRLSRGRACQSGVRHRDLRRSQAGDRKLALGRCALLSPRRQAHEEARHRNHHPVQAAPAAHL